MGRVTVLSLVFLFVRSNRISMCCVIVSSLKLFLYGQIGFLCVVLHYCVWNFYLYGQIGFTMCRVTVLSLEFLFVRSARGGFLCVVLQC